MVDKVTLTIEITPEERQQIEIAAQVPTEEVDLETREGIAAGLRQSLREMKAGLGRPISELYQNI